MVLMGTSPDRSNARSVSRSFGVNFCGRTACLVCQNRFAQARKTLTKSQLTKPATIGASRREIFMAPSKPKQTSRSTRGSDWSCKSAL